MDAFPSILHSGPETVEALQEQLLNLQNAVRQRDDLLALAAHELRNPLHALALQLTHARALASAHEVPELAASLVKAQRTLARYTDRVKLLLELVSPSAKGLSVDRRPVELREALELLAESVSAEARVRGITLELDMPEACPSVTDVAIVNQIVDNLLLNAFKHSGCQRVRIVLGSSAGFAIIGVSDDGHGIAAEDQHRFSGTAIDPKPRLNSGLGLWIVRTLAVALGGEIVLRSQAGAGAMFELRFPLVIDSSGPAT
jgi:signal transduction histidine kinase